MTYRQNILWEDRLPTELVLITNNCWNEWKKGFNGNSYLLWVAASAAGGTAAPRGGGRVLRLRPGSSLGWVHAEKRVSWKPVARGWRGHRRRWCRGCGGILITDTGRGDVCDPRPEGRVPGRGVEDSVGHGGGGRRCQVLLTLDLRWVVVAGVLLGLDLGQFDLLPGLGYGGAQVCRLGRCYYAGYLAGVLRRSEGIPMLGLPKLSSLQVGSPVVTSHGWEREESLRRGRRDATVRGFVVEEARVWQNAVRKLEWRSVAQTILTQNLSARAGAAEIVGPALALRTLRSIRHLPNAESEYLTRTSPR